MGDDFRIYKSSNDFKTKHEQLVYNHYKLMRTKQTLKFNIDMRKRYFKFHADFTFDEIIQSLDKYVDSSDPDTTSSQLIHALLTAENARNNKEPDWFVLTCFIHDWGKMLFNFSESEKYNDGTHGHMNSPQYALGGDTYIVGCAIPETIVYPEFNKLNSDMLNPKYNTKNGIYEKNCGLDNVMFTFGHDEILYQAIQNSNHNLNQESLAIIRYHSCYLIHSSNEYRQFFIKKDFDNLEFIKQFNKYDLYFKHESEPDVDSLLPYYRELFLKYFPDNCIRF